LYGGAGSPHWAIDVPSEVAILSGKKFVPAVLVRCPIVRTWGCRLLLVSVISPTLGPIHLIDGAGYGNRRAMGDSRMLKMR